MIKYCDPGTWVYMLILVNLHGDYSTKFLLAYKDVVNLLVKHETCARYISNVIFWESENMSINNNNNTVGRYL